MAKEQRISTAPYCFHVQTSQSISDRGRWLHRLVRHLPANNAELHRADCGERGNPLCIAQGLKRNVKTGTQLLGIWPQVGERPVLFCCQSGFLPGSNPVAARGELVGGSGAVPL